MKLLRVCALLFFALLVTGCATGPKFAETQSAIPTLTADQGRVYFYRSSSMFGAAIQPQITLNGAVVGDSKPGGFFFVDKAPGAMEVVTSTEVERKLTFMLEPGQTRYVRTYIGIGILAGRIYPELVDEAAAQQALQEMSYTGKPLVQR